MIKDEEWKQYCKDSGLNHYELYYIYNQWCQRLDAKFAGFLRLASEGPDCVWETETYRNFSYAINPHNYRYWFDPDHGILKRAGLLEKVLSKSKANKKNKSIMAAGRHCRSIAVGAWGLAEGPLRYEPASGSRALDTSYPMSSQVNGQLYLHYAAYQSRTNWEYQGANRKSYAQLLDVHAGLAGARSQGVLWKEGVELGSNILVFCLLPDVAFLKKTKAQLYMILLTNYNVQCGVGVDQTGMGYTRLTSGGGPGSRSRDCNMWVTGTNIQNFEFNENYINALGPKFIEKKLLKPKENKWKSECYDTIKAGLNPWHHGFAEQLPSVFDYTKPINNPDACNINMDINVNQINPMQFKDNIDKCEVSDLRDLPLGPIIKPEHYDNKTELMKPLNPELEK